MPPNWKQLPRTRPTAGRPRIAMKDSSRGESAGAPADTPDTSAADGLRGHLPAIVDSSEDAILTKTLDGTVLTWNRGAERLYGYSAEEIVGKSIALLLSLIVPTS